MGMKFPQNRMIAIFLLVTIVYLLTSCQSDSDKKPNVQSTSQNQLHILKSVTPEQRRPVVATQVPLEGGNSTCHLPPIRVSSSKVSSFYWSENSKWIIYFSESDQKWKKYLTETNVTLTLDESLTPTNPSDLMATEAEIAKIFGVNKFIDIFTSPDGRSIIFTEAAAAESYQVSLKRLGDKSATTLGSINGLVDKVFWNNKGSELLLSLDWSSPLGVADAYVYRIDLINKKMIIEFSNTPHYRNLSVIDVTPDFQWVLFVRYSDQDRSVWLRNLASLQDIKTTLKAPPLDLHWISKDEFIGVGFLNDFIDPIIYRYDIQSNKSTPMIDMPLATHQGIMMSVLISPNQNYVAFIHKDNQNLYIIECDKNK